MRLGSKVVYAYVQTSREQAQVRTSGVDVGQVDRYSSLSMIFRSYDGSSYADKAESSFESRANNSLGVEYVLKGCV